MTSKYATAYSISVNDQENFEKMASLPYITAPGNIDKALQGIRAAAVPPKISQDFVKTVLKIAGSSGDEMTSFLKKLGLAGMDGSPSELYKKYRNHTFSEATIAECIKKAYEPLYIRNEYMHAVSDQKLLGLIVEVTGQPADSRPVRLVLSCINNLKKFAKFDTETESAIAISSSHEAEGPSISRELKQPVTSTGIGLNLGYTINLNLPVSTDPAVFDAIFKSLKQHLLRSNDG